MRSPEPAQRVRLGVRVVGPRDQTASGGASRRYGLWPPPHPLAHGARRRKPPRRASAPAVARAGRGGVRHPRLQPARRTLRFAKARPARTSRAETSRGVSPCVGRRPASVRQIAARGAEFDVGRRPTHERGFAKGPHHRPGCGGARAAEVLCPRMPLSRPRVVARGIQIRDGPNLQQGVGRTARRPYSLSLLQPPSAPRLVSLRAVD